MKTIIRTLYYSYDDNPTVPITTTLFNMAVYWNILQCNDNDSRQSAEMSTENVTEVGEKEDLESINPFSITSKSFDRDVSNDEPENTEDFYDSDSYKGNTALVSLIFRRYEKKPGKSKLFKWKVSDLSFCFDACSFPQKNCINKF